MDTETLVRAYSEHAREGYKQPDVTGSRTKKSDDVSCPGMPSRTPTELVASFSLLLYYRALASLMP